MVQLGFCPPYAAAQAPADGVIGAVDRCAAPALLAIPAALQVGAQSTPRWSRPRGGFLRRANFQRNEVHHDCFVGDRRLRRALDRVRHLATRSVMSADAGSEKMQEISAAVAE